MEAFTVPVNYVEDGHVVPIVNDIIETRSESYPYANAGNAYDLKLPDDAQNTPVRFGSGGEWVKFYFADAHGDATIEGDTASYQATGVADSVEFTARPEGVKETVILDSAPSSAAVLDFPLTLSAGLKPILNADRSITVTDEVGEVVFTMPAPYMFDAAQIPSTSEDVAIDLTETDGGWALTLEPSLAWLQDPDRVYPVSVDPTINDAAVADTHITQVEPNDTHGAMDYLRVGNQSGSARRALVRFGLNGLPANATVTSANLRLYLDSTKTSGSGSPQFVARRVAASQEWNRSQATWNNRLTGVAWDSPGGVFTGSADGPTLNGSTDGYKSFDVLSSVNAWKGGATNNGVVVKQLDESSTRYLSFFSGNSSDSSRYPKLVINYTVPDSPPSKPANLLLTPGGPGFTTSLTPTISASVVDPDGDQVTTSFSIEDEAGNILWSTTAVAESGVAAAEVPEDVMSPGSRYVATAQAISGSQGLTSDTASISFQNDVMAAEKTTVACPSNCTPSETSSALFDGQLVGTTTISLVDALPADWMNVSDVYVSLEVSSSAISRNVWIYNGDFRVPVAPTTIVSESEAALAYAKVPVSGAGTVSLSADSTSALRLTLSGYSKWDEDLYDLGYTDPDYDFSDAEFEEFLPVEETDNYEESDARAIEVVEMAPSDIDEVASETPATEPRVTTISDGCEDLTGPSESGEALVACMESFQSEKAFEAAVVADLQSSETYTQAEADEQARLVASSLPCPSGKAISVSRWNFCWTSWWLTRIYKRVDGVLVPTGTQKFKLRWTVGFTGRSTTGQNKFDLRFGSSTGEGANVLYSLRTECDVCNSVAPMVELFKASKRSDSASSPAFMEYLDSLNVDEFRKRQIKFTLVPYPATSEPRIGLPTVSYSPVVRCDNASILKEAGCIFDLIIPTLHISKGKYGKSAQLIEDAIAVSGYGSSSPLSRETNRSTITENRRIARMKCRLHTRPSDYDCDEYPFASSQQGCSQISSSACLGRWVSKEENRGVGGKLGALYRRARLVQGGKYYVSVEP